MKTQDIINMAKAYAEVQEKLVGNQHKIDANKNGKIDAHDFKKLRGEQAEKCPECGKMHEKGECEMDEKYVSDAQRKAVWASKNEKGVKEEAEIEEAMKGHGFSSSDYMRGASGSRPTSGQKEYQGKEIKSFHPNKEKEAREYAKKHGYVVKKKELPKGSGNITHTWDIHKEEVDQLDELSKSTLGSYIRKASANATSATRAAGVEAGARGPNRFAKMDSKEKRADKRLTGVSKAVDRLTKEAVERATHKPNNGQDPEQGLSPNAKKEKNRTTPIHPAVDEPKVDALNFQTFKTMTKKSPMRPGDNAQGDKTPPKAK